MGAIREVFFLEIVCLKSENSGLIVMITCGIRIKFQKVQRKYQWHIQNFSIFNQKL